MNRQEALFAIDAIRSIMRDEGLLVDGDNWSDVLTNLAECIKSPQPDPDTGLAPCEEGKSTGRQTTSRSVVRTKADLAGRGIPLSLELEEDKE